MFLQDQLIDIVLTCMMKLIIKIYGSNTAKRRMSNVQNFYRWLVQDDVKFDYPLWQERDAYISFKDAQGFIGSKKINTTDLSQIN